MIRVATIKDASRLAEIQIFSKRKAFRPIFQNDDVSFNEMSVLRLALYYQDVIGALDDIYVFDDGIVKGMMKLDCKNSIWELKELYVDPFFQGEGVGTKLMRHFLTTAKSHDVKEVYLWVLEENFAARKFYESYNPQIQISAESETKRSIFREKDKTKRSKKESAQHSKSRNKSFVMTSVSAL